MNILEADFTLYQIEQTLENILKEQEQGIRTLGDLQLSYEDYKYLVLKLKGLIKYIKKLEVFEQYNLSVLTALVFQLRYETEQFYLFQEVKEILENMEQHHVRYCFQICSFTIYEMGLSTYGIEIQSVEELFEVIAIHAGFQENLMNEVLQFFEEFCGTKDPFGYEEEIYRQLSKTITHRYPCLNPNKTHELIHLYQQIYEACFCKNQSLQQLSTEFKYVSLEILQKFYLCFLKFNNQSTRLIKVR